jgi:hypothetical protein
MKTEIWIKIKYIAKDGRQFVTKKSCEDYEKELEQGLPQEYVDFVKMITVESTKNGHNLGYRWSGKISRYIKQWVQYSESSIFWNIVTPTKENYEIIKKVHKFMSPPILP